MPLPYEYRFEILNSDIQKRFRTLRSLFNHADAAHFAEEGYIRCPDLIPAEQIRLLRDATEELRRAKFGDSLQSTYRSRAFSGQYLREPQFADRRFLSLLEREPIIDSVRSLMGPRVVLRSFSIRITHPGTEAGTKWHSDQRSFVTPQPVLFTDPHVITVLLYLDDIDDQCGATYVLPGSHRWRRVPKEEELYADLPGQIALRPSAGTVIFFHAALWHRGGSNSAGGSLRRLIIQQFAPAWARQSEFEPIADESIRMELLEKAHKEGDEELRELLGLGGYM